MISFSDGHALVLDIASESNELNDELARSNPGLSEEANARRIRILGLLDRLKSLLQDPHEFVHDYVSTNWDHGALYVLLHAKVLDAIADDGGSDLTLLSEQSGIPADKLVRILRLLSCQHFVEEPCDEHFALTAASRMLVNDVDFRAWVEFQLYETRVASASLADTLLALPNDYENGESAFKHAWGEEMYDWHAARCDKAERFRKAMKGVSQSMDPADQLLKDWFKTHHKSGDEHIVEFAGRYGLASPSLVETVPTLTSAVRIADTEILKRYREGLSGDLKEQITFELHERIEERQPATDRQRHLTAYVARNLLWNWSDEDATQLLRTLLPAMEAHPEIVVLICDGLSPARNAYDPHVEQAYRRRDITMMTMHNVRQRTELEWRALFTRASPDLEVSIDIAENA
ncbi:hypothetical protein LTR78_005960 [Recurvomyces mirabilis]|uniref:O-methyltransferase C-terminal domain-containing protein n=1 Tax=Recurvomyces mirabilis TaxID=574656 RepID=A0AAE0WLW3_9PEZI|nr:hypothetical protein LTR78_005960 [Recurvomyces mirabilis]KAK5155230.1 hypothetical protein LTS14_006185 [Recurvomyces mirabilis]